MRSDHLSKHIKTHDNKRPKEEVVSENDASNASDDEDEDIDVFMKNENDVTVIENNNDGSSPNWHVLVKRRTRHEDQDGENRKSRPLSVDESQLQTHRVESRKSDHTL